MAWVWKPSDWIAIRPKSVGAEAPPTKAGQSSQKLVWGSVAMRANKATA
ncbi:DUF6053 domain-containing protein [Lysobacter sp. CA199]